MNITRKIQVVFDCDKSERPEMYKKWRKWNYVVRRAANMIVTNQYLLDHMKDIFYLSDGTKKKLSDIAKDPDGILNMSRDNTTYQILSRAFKGECPMG